MAKAFVKSLAKKAWKATKRITGNRYGRGYSQIMKKGVPQMVKDINYLKSVINSEKLRLTYNTPTPQAFGQVNGNVTAIHQFDITPNPSQGDGYNNRTGSSIKLHSTNIAFQFSQQASAISGAKFKIYIVQIIGSPEPLATTAANFFIANPFNTVVDINSSRNPDYFKNYKVLRTKTVRLSSDSTTSMTAMKSIRLGLKYKSHHVRWDKNSNTVITAGQIVMFIVADSGNMSGSTVSTLEVPVKATNTGAFVQYAYDHYYYDN